MPIQSAQLEVIHYTTAGGLAGILASNCLFATHTAFLNDSEEEAGFFSRALPRLLAQTFAEFEASAHAPLAKNWRETVIAILRDLEVGGSDIYILSLSKPETAFVARNGLLSQWRGYGHDGGYAIVFDLQKLGDRLSIEGQRFYEDSLSWADAEYGLDQDTPEASQAIVDRIEDLKSALLVFLRQTATSRGASAEAGSRCFRYMNNLRTFYKHVGFSEEKEMRVVLSLPGKLVGIDQKKVSPLPYRPIKHYLRNGVSVPCVHLFGDGEPLPIKRIIVGPHPDKQARKRAVEILLSGHGILADVEISDIPYRGRG